MKEVKSFNRTIAFFISKASITLLLCILICALCKLPLIDGLKYYLFLICGLFIPGMAILCLLKIDKRNIIEFSLYSCAAGLFLLLIEYLLVMILKIKSFAWILSFLVFLVTVYFVYKNKLIYTELEYDRNWKWMCAIEVLLITVCFFAIAYANVAPDKFGGTVFDKDFLFWIGNSLSFAKGLPVQNFRLVGEKFFYHYFSSVLITESSFACGIDIVTLSFYFSFIVPCILLVEASYVFLKRLLKNDLYVFIGMFLILMCDGLTSYLPDNLYYCPFGYDYAYAFSMIAFNELVIMFQNDKFTLKNVAVSCLLIVLTTGFKGPNGLIVLMAFGIITFSLLIRKEWKKGFVLGSVWLLSFIITYFLFITDIFAKGERTNGLIFTGLLGSFDSNSFAIKILSKLLSFGFPDNGFSRIIALGLYVFLNNNGAMLLLGIGLIICIYLLFKKKFDVLLLALLAVSFWGIILTIITHQDGNSQMYFIMSAFPFCTLTGLHALEQIDLKKACRIIVIALIIAVSISDIISFVNRSVYYNVTKAFFLQQGGQLEGDRRYYFSAEEYKLALWLKENTDEYDYIALDVLAYDGMRKEVMLGVFSDRFIWDDGQYSDEKERERRRSLSLAAAKGDKKAFDALKDESVDYLIQTLSQNPERLEDYDIVYDSDGFVVYKIN